MLRRPGEWPVVRLGEGCSSTAINLLAIATDAAWGNLAIRGSASVAIANKLAVP
jgi:hypothetical protein